MSYQAGTFDFLTVNQLVIQDIQINKNFTLNADMNLNNGFINQGGIREESFQQLLSDRSLSSGNPVGNVMYRILADELYSKGVVLTDSIFCQMSGRIDASVNVLKSTEITGTLYQSGGDALIESKLTVNSLEIRDLSNPSGSEFGLTNTVITQTLGTGLENVLGDTVMTNLDVSDTVIVERSVVINRGNIQDSAVEGAGHPLLIGTDNEVGPYVVVTKFGEILIHKDDVDKVRLDNAGNIVGVTVIGDTGEFVDVEVDNRMLAGVFTNDPGYGGSINKLDQTEITELDVGELTVTGQTTMQGPLIQTSFVGANSMQETNFQEGITVSAAAYLEGGIQQSAVNDIDNYLGGTTIMKNLIVTGSMDLQVPVDYNGPINQDGYVGSERNSLIGTDMLSLTVLANAEVNGGMSIGGNVEIGGGLDVDVTAIGYSADYYAKFGAVSNGNNYWKLGRAGRLEYFNSAGVVNSRYDLSESFIEVATIDASEMDVGILRMVEHSVGTLSAGRLRMGGRDALVYETEVRTDGPVRGNLAVPGGVLDIRSRGVGGDSIDGLRVDLFCPAASVTCDVSVFVYINGGLSGVYTERVTGRHDGTIVTEFGGVFLSGVVGHRIYEDMLIRISGLDATMRYYVDAGSCGPLYGGPAFELVYRNEGLNMDVDGAVVNGELRVGGGLDCIEMVIGLSGVEYVDSSEGTLFGVTRDGDVSVAGGMSVSGGVTVGGGVEIGGVLEVGGLTTVSVVTDTLEVTAGGSVTGNMLFSNGRIDQEGSIVGTNTLLASSIASVLTNYATVQNSAGVTDVLKVVPDAVSNEYWLHSNDGKMAWVGGAGGNKGRVCVNNLDVSGGVLDMNLGSIVDVNSIECAGIYQGVADATFDAQFGDTVVDTLTVTTSINSNFIDVLPSNSVVFYKIGKVIDNTVTLNSVGAYVSIQFLPIFTYVNEAVQTISILARGSPAATVRVYYNSTILGELFLDSIVKRYSLDNLNQVIAGNGVLKFELRSGVAEIYTSNIDSNDPTEYSYQITYINSATPTVTQVPIFTLRMFYTGVGTIRIGEDNSELTIEAINEDMNIRSFQYLNAHSDNLNIGVVGKRLNIDNVEINNYDIIFGGSIFQIAIKFLNTSPLIGKNINSLTLHSVKASTGSVNISAYLYDNNFNSLKLLNATSFGSFNYTDVVINFDSFICISGYYIVVFASGPFNIPTSFNYETSNMISYLVAYDELIETYNQYIINFNYKVNTDIIEITRDGYNDEVQLSIDSDEVIINTNKNLIFDSNKIIFNSNAFTNEYPYGFGQLTFADLVHSLARNNSQPLIPYHSVAQTGIVFYPDTNYTGRIIKSLTVEYFYYDASFNYSYLGAMPTVNLYAGRLVAGQQFNQEKLKSINLPLNTFLTQFRLDFNDLNYIIEDNTYLVVGFDVTTDMLNHYYNNGPQMGYFKIHFMIPLVNTNYMLDKEFYNNTTTIDFFLAELNPTYTTNFNTPRPKFDIVFSDIVKFNNQLINIDSEVFVNNNIDLNDNKILNLAEPTTDYEPIRIVDYDSKIFTLETIKYNPSVNISGSDSTEWLSPFYFNYIFRDGFNFIGRKCSKFRLEDVRARVAIGSSSMSKSFDYDLKYYDSSNLLIYQTDRLTYTDTAPAIGKLVDIEIDTDFLIKSNSRVIIGLYDVGSFTRTTYFNFQRYTTSGLEDISDENIGFTVTFSLASKFTETNLFNNNTPVFSMDIVNPKLKNPINNNNIDVRSLFFGAQLGNPFIYSTSIKPGIYTFTPNDEVNSNLTYRLTLPGYNLLDFNGNILSLDYTYITTQIRRKLSKVTVFKGYKLIIKDLTQTGVNSIVQLEEGEYWSNNPVFSTITTTINYDPYINCDCCYLGLDNQTNFSTIYGILLNTPVLGTVDDIHTASIYSGIKFTKRLYDYGDSDKNVDPPSMIVRRLMPIDQGASPDTERSELIIFHSNDGTNINDITTGFGSTVGNAAGQDTITIRAPFIRLQTFNNENVTTINNAAGSINRMTIDSSGNTIFNVPGVTINSDSFQIINQTNDTTYSQKKFHYTMNNDGFRIRRLTSPDHSWWQGPLWVNGFPSPIANLSRGYFFGFDSAVNPIAYIDNTKAGINILNFTGQHRNKINDETFSIDKNIGLIVISTGKYCPQDLSNAITINEALPIIELSKTRKDKRVFGVISNKEDESNIRIYNTGAFGSIYDKDPSDSRIIVNSLGEGAIWVTNIYGDFENGDYITSSEIPGYGGKQDDDLLHNYTVAKITCDCSFDLHSDIYKCEEFTHNDITYRRAFVGCTYHCG